MVNWDRVPMIFLRSFEYLAILFPCFDEDVLWHNEAMWDKVPESVWYVKDVIVMFFFGHDGHDLVQSTGYGRVVSVLPVE